MATCHGEEAFVWLVGLLNYDRQAYRLLNVKLVVLV